MGHPLEVHLLGRFAVMRDGEEVPATAFGGRKARRLVRVLAMRRGSVVPQDRLVDALWGDAPPADPAGNLSVLVTRARGAVGDRAWISAAAGGYALTGSCTVDAERFTAAASLAREHEAAGDARAGLAACRSALAHWSGEPLPEDGDEEWAAAWRADLVRRHHEVLETAAALALELDEPTLAREYADAAIAADPFRESGYLTSARALARSGAVAAALDVLAGLTRLLADELGLYPSPEIEGLRRELLTVAPAPAARAAPPPAAPTHADADLAFAGRRAVLTAIDAAARAGPDGRAGVVLLTGEAGAGKSRTLAEWAARSPMRVVTARAFAPQRTEPFSLARGVFRGLLALDPALHEALGRPATAAVDALVSGANDRSGVLPDQASIRALLVESGVRLAQVLSTGPARLTIVLDDLQWADATSLSVLASVLDQVESVPCVLAARASELDDDGPAARFGADLAAHRPVDRIELPPLSPAELAEVLDPRLAETLATVADGHPFTVTDLLQGLADDGLVERRGSGWVLGRDVGDRLDGALAELADIRRRRAFRSRVLRLGPAQRRLLVTMSVLARPAPVRTLAAASGEAAAAVHDHLQRLAAAGLVRRAETGWATSHDLVHETVVADLPDAERARTHADLAAALRDEGAEPSELAGHLAGAGDGDAAAGCYAQAAAVLVEGAADVEAAALVDAGLAGTRRDDLRRPLLALRSRLRARRGDAAGAREDLASALATCPAGGGRSRLLADQAMLHLGADDLLRASAIAELAVVEAGDDTGARARALEVASVVDMNLDRADRAGRRSADAYELYAATGDGLGAARILDARAMATFLDGRVTAALAEFRQVTHLFSSVGALLRVVTPRSTLGHALVFAGRPGEGLVEAAGALEVARSLGHQEGRTYALWHLAEAMSASGRHAEALAAATEARDVAAALGHRGWTATGWRALGVVHHAAGRLDAAEDAFRRSLAAAEGFSLFTSWAASRLALVLVGQGRAAEAAALLPTARSQGPGLARYESDQADVAVAVAVGDPAAKDLLRQALSRAEAGGHAAGVARLRELMPA
jgi:DNA-binding SARP family transcriptional activator/tetratricopeptide (TPR) repeat protein